MIERDQDAWGDWPDWDEDALPENPDDDEVRVHHVWWRQDVQIRATTPDGEPVL